jgi:hypothetical protein
MNAATVAAKRPVFFDRHQEHIKDSEKSKTYKDEDSLGVALPILGERFVLSIRFRKVDRPDLARNVAVRLGTALRYT